MEHAMNPDALVDISAVSVDKTLTRVERENEFFRQLKDPHRFKSAKLNVTAKYANNGVTLEECLRRMMMI